MPLQSLFSISILLVTHRLMVSLHTSTISATLPCVKPWSIFLNANRLSSACVSSESERKSRFVDVFIYAYCSIFDVFVGLVNKERAMVVQRHHRNSSLAKPSYSFQTDISLAFWKAEAKRAHDTGGWINFVVHFVDQPNQLYNINSADLAALIVYMKSIGMAPITGEQGVHLVLNKEAK